MQNISTKAVGTVAPAAGKEQRSEPNEKTILVCRPGGKWDVEAVA
jgi:hypothetical protein